VLLVVPALALATWLAHARGVSWSLLAAGALVFLGAQVLRRPLNAALARALAPRPLDPFLLALTAAVVEEGARYAALRWLLPGVRRGPEALMLAAGHAGLEAMLLALAAAGAFVRMARLRRSPPVLQRLPAARQAAVRARLAAYWAAPAAAPLLGAVERLTALAVHAAGALLALRAVAGGPAAWLGAAIALHAAVDAGALALAARTGRAARR
jgi:uncharacterized membrane protein YhfC